MAASEYDRCHAKDFCPLRDECRSLSSEDSRVVSSSQMTKGDMVWSIDRGNRYLFVVRSGLFVSFVPFADGCEHLFALFPHGIVSGVADLWVNQEAAMAYGLRCLVPGVLCRIQADWARESLERKPDALPIVASLMTNTSSGGLELTRILSEKEPTSRLIRLFTVLRDMVPGRRDHRVFRFTQNELASIVSESRPAVTRALDQLEATGAVERGYGKITVFFDKLPPLTESVGVRSPLFYAE